MSAKIWDNKYGGSRYAGVQDYEYWERKHRQCPTRWNGNGGFDGFVSVSCRISDDKEATCPVYCTQDHGNDDSALNIVLYIVC